MIESIVKVHICLDSRLHPRLLLGGIDVKVEKLTVAEVKEGFVLFRCHARLAGKPQQATIAVPHRPVPLRRRRIIVSIVIPVKTRRSRQNLPWCPFRRAAAAAATTAAGSHLGRITTGSCDHRRRGRRRRRGLRSSDSCRGTISICRCRCRRGCFQRWLCPHEFCARVQVLARLLLSRPTVQYNPEFVIVILESIGVVEQLHTYIHTHRERERDA